MLRNYLFTTKLSPIVSTVWFTTTKSAMVLEEVQSLTHPCWQNPCASWHSNGSKILSDFFCLESISLKPTFSFLVLDSGQTWCEWAGWIMQGSITNSRMVANWQNLSIFLVGVCLKCDAVQVISSLFYTWFCLEIMTQSNLWIFYNVLWAHYVLLMGLLKTEIMGHKFL